MDPLHESGVLLCYSIDGALRVLLESSAPPPPREIGAGAPVPETMREPAAPFFGEAPTRVDIAFGCGGGPEVTAVAPEFRGLPGGGLVTAPSFGANLGEKEWVQNDRYLPFWADAETIPDCEHM